MEPLSTIKYQNIHPDSDEIFLGLLSKEKMQRELKNIQTSFFGGEPLWLYQPNQNQIKCKRCFEQNKIIHKNIKKQAKQLQNQKKGQQGEQKLIEKTKQQLMTFIGQIFCPLEAQRCYYRIIYLFYCQKCKIQFQAVRQQCSREWKPNQQKKQQKKCFKLLTDYSIEVQTEMITKKQFSKVLNQSRLQVQEEVIEQDDDQDDQLQQQLKQETKYQVNLKQHFEQTNFEKQGSLKEINQGQVKVEKDVIFECYRKCINKFNFPVIVYGGVSLQYNNTILNPRHKCPNCQNSLKLQFQITQQLLSTGVKQLALMDWGSIFVYTCVGSCEPSNNLFQQQQIVIQYQLDAIKQKQVRELKKKNKKRNKDKQRKINKSKSKSKSHSESQESEKNQKNNNHIVNTNIKDKQQNAKDKQENDWD